MGKKYLDTKKHSVESSILSVWQEASLKQEKLDAVNKNAVKKKFDDRKDKDIDNDGDVDSSDKYLHKRRKAVSKAVKKNKKEEVKEYYEMGTDEYRKHTQDVTPGEDGEWVDAVKKKNESMREALAKVWNTTEDKNPFKKEAKKDLTKEVKNGKTMTGKKIASVDINPTIKEKAK